MNNKKKIVHFLKIGVMPSRDYRSNYDPLFLWIKVAERLFPWIKEAERLPSEKRDQNNKTTQNQSQVKFKN